jgi:hypothetical protein
VELLILKDFKSFVLELLNLKELPVHFMELLILKELADFLLRDEADIPDQKDYGFCL